MPKTSHPWVHLVVAAVVSAAVAAAPVFAGPRIAPVAAMCPADRPERTVDADGKDDRCVARAEPTCPASTDLRSDAKREADVCVAASTASTDEGKSPKCADGFRLRVAAGKDRCEKSGPPSCPTGFSLKTVKGQDQCHY